MIIIVNSDEEEDSTRRALEVINTLRRRPINKPIIEDTPWVTTRFANPAYL